MVFINPKIDFAFNKELPELETTVDKWLYFLNSARNLKNVPATMEAIPEIKKAFYIANQANLTLEELEDQEKSEIFFQDQRGAITKALRQGREQGIKEGREEGQEMGRVEGREEGEKRKAFEIAKKMLNVLDDIAICEMTGLALAEVESLKG